MNRRGQINDVSIAFGIIVFLTIVTITFGYLNSELNSPSVTNNVPTSLGVSTDLSAFGTAGLLFNYIFWGFGIIPFWINAIIMIPLKLILLFILIKNLVPFIGGG